MNDVIIGVIIFTIIVVCFIVIKDAFGIGQIEIPEHPATFSIDIDGIKTVHQCQTMEQLEECKAEGLALVKAARENDRHSHRWRWRNRKTKCSIEYKVNCYQLMKVGILKPTKGDESS